MGSGNQILAHGICSLNKEKYSYIDKNNIAWKFVNDEWIGKRTVWTKDNRACWLEETSPENVKSYWLGKDVNYNEIFKMPKNKQK